LQRKKALLVDEDEVGEEKKDGLAGYLDRDYKGMRRNRDSSPRKASLKALRRGNIRARNAS